MLKIAGCIFVQGHGYGVDQTVVSKLIVCGQSLGQPRWIKGVVTPRVQARACATAQWTPIATTLYPFSLNEND